jgi:hypothetical protein
MNRAIISLSFSLFLLLVGSPLNLHARPGTPRLLNIQASKKGPAERAYFHSASGDVEALLTLRKHLIRQGARNVNCFVPFVVTCELPNDISYDEYLMNTDITLLAEEDIDIDTEGGFVFGPTWIKKCYQFSHEIPATEEEDLRNLASFEEFVMPDIALPNKPGRRISISSPSEPQPRRHFQNSEFMIGDILAQVIYPESQGTEENWSNSQLSQAASGCVLGMVFYQEAFPHVPINFVVRSLPWAVTTTEPINFTREEQSIWVTDVMNHLGYPGTPAEYLNIVTQFNNEWRTQWGTDWVFTAFIVNSTNDPDHLFGVRPAKPLQLVVSEHGGPHLAIPFPTGYPGLGPLKQAFLYGLGHIFWAAFENHGIPEFHCNSYSGYLNYRNWNKVVSIGPRDAREGCSTSFYPDSCIMNIEDVYYAFHKIPCPFTVGMLGLADKNNNRVPDAVDAAPEVIFNNTALETTFNDSFQLKFQAISAAVPNKNSYQNPIYRIDYALPIKEISYLVNGVGPIQILPDDGVYDEVMEDFTAELNTLIPGVTEVKVKTRNTMGATSEEGFIKNIYYIGLHYIHFAFSFLNEGVGISWNMLGETFDAKFDLHRIETAPVPSDSIIASDIQPSIPPSWYFTTFYVFDGNVVPGRKYRYYIEGTFTVQYHGQDTTITHISNEFEATASLHIDKQNIISAPSPNPFRDKTWVSILVPSSFRESGSQNPQKSSLPGNVSGTPAVQDDVPTNVNVTIYNALGQRIRNLYSGWSYSTVLTIGWDGTNDNNERVPTGVYFLRAKAGPYTQVQKVLIIR